MRLPDVNLLVHAVNDVSAAQPLAARWLAEGFDSGDGVALAWVAMLGFLRVTTRPGIFPRPLAPDQALGLLNRWLAQPAARVVHPGPRHAAILGRYLLTGGPAGNLTTDAHLATLAHEHGATVGTFDRDFQRFDRIRVDWLGQR
ncbi:MAG: TA system VapC family ribonuclease toxin [Rubrivivax sp.]